MAGSEKAVTYTEKLLRDVRMSPRGDGLSVIWMHIMPFLQEPVKDIFNYSKKMHIRACDFIADGFQEMHAEDPYEAMAEKMVYCIGKALFFWQIAFDNFFRFSGSLF